MPRRRQTAMADSLCRASYFSAALEILAADGPSALTIAVLCARLGVTKGSFYHHFDGRRQFVEAFLRYWQAEHASRLVAISESITDIDERIPMLKAIAVGLPHEAEAAIRVWSAGDPAVARALAEVDRIRTAHITETYLAAGLDPERAEVLATLSMSALIGMQQLVRPARPDLYRAVFDEVEASLARAVRG